MQRTSIAALLIVAGLIVADSAAASASGRRPFALRLLCVVADILPASRASAAGPVRATGERVIVQRAEQPKPYLNLSNDATYVPVEYGTGAGVAELAGATSAHALASADFDEDGVPDLVGGYTGASGVGVITLQRGNVDAIYPNSPEARERRARGNFNDEPFQQAAGAFVVPEAASVVGAGDFDADGHWDVVAARRGGRTLYFLRGDGRGNLAAAERVELPGALTAFTTGEMNRRDGLTDIVVAINGNSGASVLVFESPAGALRGQPESLSLQAPASCLALGALDADAGANDLAIAAGSELLIVRGRDRRLSLGAESRAGVAEARVSRSTFEFTLAAVAVGDFAGDERVDVALLSTDGAVQVLTRAGSEKSARAMNGAQTNNAQPNQLGDDATNTIEWHRSKQISMVESTTEVSVSAHVLVTAKVSSLGKDDLLVLGGGRAHVITNEAPRVQAGEKAKRGEVGNVEAAADLRVAGSVAAESKVAAVLPMRLNSSALSSLVVLGMDSKAPSVVSPAAVTFTVNSSADTDDANPGNGECKDANGNCTLRAALRETISNADAGPYTINFNIPGAGVPTISTSGFFNVSNGGNFVGKPVVIDGTTQAAGRVEIIDTAGHSGLLHIAGGNSTLRGLVMSGSGNDGGSILLGSGNNIVEGCYIGTNADGTALAARRSNGGIYVNGSNNRIGGTTAAARNVISGVFNFGIRIDAGSGNLIEGNYIGTNAAGTAALGNGQSIQLNASGNTIGGTAPGAGNLISGNENRFGAGAVYIRGVFATVQGNLFGTDASGNAHIGNTGDALYVESKNGVTTIGGTTPAARNIISSSTGRGIYIDSTLNDDPAYVQGNYIGTNADGTVALPNLGHGITVGSDGIIVGGAVTGAGNLISGNGVDGINVEGHSNVIQGNLIGTDVSGTLAIPNASDGVEIFANGVNGAQGNLIGGTTPEARNVISGNRDNGINYNNGGSSNPNRAEGNYIGTNRFGTGALGNGRHGVFMPTGAGNNVGGTNAGAGNLIAHNNDAGIASNRDLIGGAALSNSIHSNAGLGIDIADDGVSPDSSVHPGIRRPTLTSVTNTDAGTVITGTIPNHNSSTPFTIQFFSNPACDPSGHGEGQTLIGQTTFTPAQNTTFNFSHTVSPAVPGGTSITALAIRQHDGQPPNIFYTSEFSNCAQLAAPTPTPTPTPSPGASPTPTPTPIPVPLQLFVIAPNRGGDAAAVTRQITGQGFQPGTIGKLTRAGQPDIVGTATNITNNGTTLTATFNLIGKARGLWSVVVTNPGGASAILTEAFTIGESRPANVWVDIIGRFKMRLGRTQTFYIAYGNTGDVDAAPTMLHILIPPGLNVVGLPRLANGGIPVVHRQGSSTGLEFYVPRIAAASSTYLPLELKTDISLAHTDVRIQSWALSSPGLREATEAPPDPPSTATVETLEKTDNQEKYVIHVNGPAGNYDVAVEASVTPDTQVREASFERVEVGDEVHYRYEISVANAQSPAPRPASKTEPGEVRPLEAESILRYFKTVKVKEVRDNDYMRLTLQGRRYVHEEVSTWRVNQRLLLECLRLQGLLPRPDPGYPHNSYLDKVADGETTFLVTEAIIRDSNDKVTDHTWTPTSFLHHPSLSGPNFDKALVDALEYSLGPEASALSKEYRSIDVETRDQAMMKLLLLILSKCYCSENNPPKNESPLQDAHIVAEAAACSTCPGAAACTTCEGCDKDLDNTDLNIVFAADPNDKVGSQGTGAQHYINGEKPSSYAIFFENKPEATAPAQDVVITNQLDVSKFDLSTFQLGPISFGKDTFVTPPAGLSQWTTDVNLRPANNLIVRVDARLNPQTGVVRWTFTSLDPLTMLPTDNPEAGFLPPNKSAPEGEGSALFNVSPKPGLAIGTEIRNDARIVFDVNAPIDTPVWLNTIDNSLPTSQVSQLAATQPFIVFYVNWAGTDTGSGLGDYTVFFSEDGGAYNVWLSETTNTSGIFAGKPGKTYAFYASARDKAGNVEAAKTSPEARTTTPNVVTNSIDDARFFVLQHYRNFLGREPDPSGFDFWTNQIAACGTDAGCVEVKRINVSVSFFLSIEFQQTGYLVERSYKSAYGDATGNSTFGGAHQLPVPVIRLSDFRSDTQLITHGVIVLQQGWEQQLENNKQAFFLEFVQRARFTTALPTSMTPAQFVDALNANAGNALSSSERATAINLFSGASDTTNMAARAQVLRQVAEDPDLYNAEFNRAFVLMQYFGYLSRNPNDAPDSDYTGYDFWLTKLNQFNGNYINAEMVKAFITSIEYRQRFGP